MLLAVEHTDAGGAVHLMGREGIEIDVEGTDVDVHVGRGLSAVDHYGDSHGMGVGGDFGDGVDGSEDVADMADADETRALVEEGAEGFHVETSVGEDGNDAQEDALAVAEELPGDDVGVMLHDGEDDFVAVFEEGTEAGGHEVDCLGGAAGEDDFAGGGGVNVSADALAGGLHHRRGLLGYGEDATVDVGLVLIVHIVDGLDHATRGLGCGGIVEVDERTAVDVAAQYGKFFAKIIDGIHGGWEDIVLDGETDRKLITGITGCIRRRRRDGRRSGIPPYGADANAGVRARWRR